MGNCCLLFYLSGVGKSIYSDTNESLDFFPIAEDWKRLSLKKKVPEAPKRKHHHPCDMCENVYTSNSTLKTHKQADHGLVTILFISLIRTVFAAVSSLIALTWR